jgi:hypothetical protein
MRKIALLSVVALFVACGGTTSSGGSGAITGTIGGTAFTAVTDLALFGAGNRCDIALAPGIPLGLSMAVVASTDAVTTCNEALTCVEHKNTRNIGLIIAKANYTTGNAPALAVGSYTFLDIAAILGGAAPSLVPDASGNISIFAANVAGLNATCGEVPYQVTAGTLSITAVTATSITGTVSLTLGNGAGSVSGKFTSTGGCGVPSFNACEALNGVFTGGGAVSCTGTPTCI